MDDPLVKRAAAYYTACLREHGPGPRGVDWNSADSQVLRFRQLLRIAEGAPHVDINDYGCGYGALVDELTADGRPFTYFGYDAAPDMVEALKRRHEGRPNVAASADRADLQPRAYTVASGLFNVKQDTPADVWWTYILRTLDDIAAVSRAGFAFNVLTAYADADRMRPDLYYADPARVFDHCMRRYSRRVAILHDTPLYEFTVLVRL